MAVQAVMYTLVCIAGLYGLTAAAEGLTLQLLYPRRRLYAPTLCAELVGTPLVWLLVCVLPSAWLWAVPAVRLVWALPLFGVYRLLAPGPWRLHAAAATAVGGMTAAVGAMLWGVVRLL